MTENQKLQQAVDIVEKHSGNIASAAKELDIPRRTLSGRYNKAIDKGYVAGIKPLEPDQEIGLDSKLKNTVKEKRELQKKYNELLKLFEQQTEQSKAIDIFNKNLQNISFDNIKISSSGKPSESTAVILCSDLHYEETINPQTVDGLNEYNTKIAKERFNKVFQNGLKLVDMCRSKSNIDNLVLWLGGDLINGYIHPELIENNSMSPIESSIDVYKMCVSAIDFLVENGGFKKIIIPTSIGNHGRTTDKKRISTSAENSYEWLIYNFLANKYEKSNIVEFKLSKSYFNWLNIYGHELRFHHGDFVRYAGGIGGIEIPLKKAIANWNQSRVATIDILGHWHQRLSSKNFVVNSSIVGYGPYSVSIKAPYEKPQQSFFLMHPKGKTVEAPIWVD